jgi:hypothetical protein
VDILGTLQQAPNGPVSRRCSFASVAECLTECVQLLKDRAVWGALGIAIMLNMGMLPE